MAVLAQVITALNILSTSFEMVPLVGENLKAAAELAAKEHRCVWSLSQRLLAISDRLESRSSRKTAKATRTSECKLPNFS
jgi:hypothetical protein